MLLLLVGGAVADRAGAFRVLLLGDGVMLAVTLALALALSAAGLSPVLLVGAALAIGIVDAFYLPASGTMPRRLAPGPPLARAMAARQLTGQLAAFAGAPLGGLLVAAGGPGGSRPLRRRDLRGDAPRPGAHPAARHGA